MQRPPENNSLGGLGKSGDSAFLKKTKLEEDPRPVDERDCWFCGDDFKSDNPLWDWPVEPIR
jgi:hypothetical protein